MRALGRRGSSQVEKGLELNRKPSDFALALLGFVLLVAWQAPPLVVVLIGALGGVGLGFIG